MTLEHWIIFIAFPIAGYLLGSVPFAWIIGRAHGVDLRRAGSKNIGASNLARVLGTKYFFYAFFLDAAKGFIPVFSATCLGARWNMSAAIGHEMAFWTVNNLGLAVSQPAPFVAPIPVWSPLLTALTCVVGHLFPLWLKFRGGKGVATGFGVVVGFWPLFTIAGLLALGVWVFTLMVYRYISVSSMSGVSSFAIFVLVLGRWRDNPLAATYLPWNELAPLLGAACLLVFLIVIQHRGNIRRLLEGTEVTVGYREAGKAKKDDPPTPSPM